MFYLTQHQSEQNTGVQEVVCKGVCFHVSNGLFNRALSSPGAKCRITNGRCDSVCLSLVKRCHRLNPVTVKGTKATMAATLLGLCGSSERGGTDWSGGGGWHAHHAASFSRVLSQVAPEVLVNRTRVLVGAHLPQCTARLSDCKDKCIWLCAGRLQAQPGQWGGQLPWPLQPQVDLKCPSNTGALCFSPLRTKGQKKSII